MKLTRSEIARMGQAAFRAKTTPQQRAAWGRIPRPKRDARERFEAKYIPEPNSGCWLWLASGYGRDYGGFQLDGRPWLAHRVSWELYRGPIPDGLVVDHMCRTKMCVNPDHLRVVTPRINAIENSSSPIAMMAAQTNCPKCHGPYTTITEGGRSVRRCKPCRRLGDAWRASQGETE